MKIYNCCGVLILNRLNLITKKKIYIWSIFRVAVGHLQRELSVVKEKKQQEVGELQKQLEEVSGKKQQEMDKRVIMRLNICDDTRC